MLGALYADVCEVCALCRSVVCDHASVCAACVQRHVFCVVCDMQRMLHALYADVRSLSCACAVDDVLLYTLACAVC